MKSYTKCRYVPSLTTSATHEKVSSKTEYETLRAEKLFRYEYSNQLNTSLLTFAFTVFTAGLAIFTLMFGPEGSFFSNGEKSTSDGIPIVFSEYFFACFFLLPCFFSRINFRYTVKNSLRIGQLTEYIRQKISFDDGESWESFKRKYAVNYFYKKTSSVGGAKDIPFWINLISIGLSIAVGAFGIFNLCTYNDLSFYPGGICLICFGAATLLITICIKFIEPLLAGKCRTITKITFLVLATIAGIICIIYLNDKPYNISLIIILVWYLSLLSCIFITPQYDREIELANCVLEYTRAKLEDSKNKPQCIPLETQNKQIFNQFLNTSTVIKDYQKVVEKCPLRKWDVLRRCTIMLSMLDVGNRNPADVMSDGEIYNCLVERIIKKQTSDK